MHTWTVLVPGVSHDASESLLGQVTCLWGFIATTSVKPFGHFFFSSIENKLLSVREGRS